MREGQHSERKFPARHSLWCNVLWIASVGIVYFAAARFSLSYLVQVEGITPIWPASGIFMSAILLSRAELRPWIIGGLCITDLLAEITAGTPFLVAGLYAAAVSGDAALGSWLLLRFAGEGITFKRVREVVVFLAFAVILSNCLWGVLATTASQYFPTTNYLRFWGWWVASEGMGNLLVTPFLLSWAGVTTLGLGQWKSKRIIEGAALFIPLTVLNYGAFYYFSDHSVFSLLHAYITFPFLLWAALRFGVRGVTAGVIILAGIALHWVVMGRDAALAPQASHWNPVILIQLYLAIITIPSFLLAAVMTERQENHALLQAEMVERKEAESALLERNRQLVTLSSASERINAVLDTPVVLRKLVASALELTRATGGTAGQLSRGRDGVYGVQPSGKGKAH